MKTIYALDWYTSKYIKVDQVSPEDVPDMNAGDFLVYHVDNGDTNALSIWVYLGYKVETDRKATYERILLWKEKEYFDEQQEFAQSVYPIFRKSFKERFDNSKPVAARYHIFAHQVYFYFYAEERYAFGDYVRFLREKVGKNIFLFQVWARDMVRLSPSSKSFLTVDGRPLHGSTTWPLPSIPMDNIMLQNLDGRDVERLKWWSGKLKESIWYEAELYEEEAQKYPARGSRVTITSGNIHGTCLSFNIMNWHVTVKSTDNEIFRLPLSQLKFSTHWKKESHNRYDD